MRFVKFGTDSEIAPLIVKTRGFPELTGRESMVNVSHTRIRFTAPPEFVMLIFHVYETPGGRRVERSRLYAVEVPVFTKVNTYGTEALYM